MQNATTWMLPGEVFPTEVRATCHGISAAAGKVRGAGERVRVRIQGVGWDSGFIAAAAGTARASVR